MTFSDHCKHTFCTFLSLFFFVKISTPRKKRINDRSRVLSYISFSSTITHNFGFCRLWPSLLVINIRIAYFFQLFKLLYFLNFNSAWLFHSVDGVEGLGGFCSNATSFALLRLRGLLLPCCPHIIVVHIAVIILLFG